VTFLSSRYLVYSGRPALSQTLTLAWLAYSTQYDGKIVWGSASASSGPSNAIVQEGWLGKAFLFARSRSELIEDPNKGALWPWIKDIDVYRCPRGRKGHAATYATVVAANGELVEGTYIKYKNGSAVTAGFGQRIGSTVLRLKSLTDIVSPGAGQRAVFIDMGQTPVGNDFYVYYLQPEWSVHSAPPVRHGDGTTLSMEDGHAEYWRWKGRETVNIPRELYPYRWIPAALSEILTGGTMSRKRKTACPTCKGCKEQPGVDWGIRIRWGVESARVRSDAVRRYFRNALTGTLQTSLTNG